MGRAVKAVLASVVCVTVHQSATAQAQDDPAPSEGILAVPDYSGDLRSRSRLLGDWGGRRGELARKGVQLDLDWSQTLQSVVDGGRDTDTRYGGSADAFLQLDLMRMRVLPGALVEFRAESRYGESVNTIAGPILPVSLDGFMPVATTPDEDIPFTISDLAYYQFLSESLVLYLGKFDTLGGDPNEFASGRGNTQFLNGNFVFSPVITGLVPYSTLGGGVEWLASSNVSFSSSIFTTAEASTTTGFDGIGDGWTWASEVDFKYSLVDLPGGQNVGFVYAWANEFADLDDAFVFGRDEGLALATESEAWGLYWSAWQYMFIEDGAGAATPIDLTNGRPDHEGVGFFARAGFGDGDTTPMKWTASGGIGGRGVLPSRDNDLLGIGYYYTSLDTGRFSGLLGAEDHAQGFECFYNVAITPAAQLTFDVQVVEAPSEAIDTGVVLGARLFLRF